MAFFSQPLSGFFNKVKPGLLVIAAVAVLRFLMLPVFGIPYSDGTSLASVFIVSTIIVLIYGAAHGATGGSAKDLLAVAAIIMYSVGVIISVAILIDEGLGIDTYYTDPAHGGSNSIVFHVFGHLVIASTVFTLVTWLLSSVAAALGRRFHAA